MTQRPRTRQSADSLLPTALIQDHITAASNAYADYKRTDCIQELTMRMQANDAGWLDTRPLEFDSPLEALFWVWWIAMSRLERYRPFVAIRHKTVKAEDQTFVIDFGIVAGPQCSVSPTPIAVELDGHEFHERTKDQVTRRDFRDRVLQRAGWRVFHFSWSTFTANPESCLLEVLEAAYDLYADAMRQRVAVDA